MSNFFGSIIDEEIPIKPPITILKEFSQDLTVATQGLLIGNIEKGMYENSHSVELFFYIVAPSLNNYSYKTFTIYHDLANPYPLEICKSDGTTFEKPKNPEELNESLKKIFSLSEIKGLINGLLSQVK